MTALDLAIAVCSGGLVAVSMALAWRGLTDPTWAQRRGLR